MTFMIDFSNILLSPGSHYLLINDFGFTSITLPIRVPDSLIIKCPGKSSCEAPQFDVPDKDINEFVKFINENELEKAFIILDDISFLRECPGLKFLRVIPSFESNGKFDFSPLYELPEIKYLSCQNIYGSREQYIGAIDLVQINGLIYLDIDVNKGMLNYNKVETLKTLAVSYFKGKNQDLTDLFSSKQLDSLWLIFCKMKSLNGIDQSECMTYLYLDYNRDLCDISALKQVKKTLKRLRILNCPKIKDFSVLRELENLERLELMGNNTLADLSFIKDLKKLKYFCFDMNVMDGDLSNCLSLDFAISDKDRKHYNLKDKDLPKIPVQFSVDEREIWRQIDELF